MRTILVASGAIV